MLYMLAARLRVRERDEYDKWRSAAGASTLDRTDCASSAGVADSRQSRTLGRRHDAAAAGATAAFMAAVSTVAGGNYTSDLIVPAAFVGGITKVANGAMHVLGHKRQTTTPYHDDTAFQAAFKIGEDALRDQQSTKAMSGNAVFGAVFGALIYASRGAAAPQAQRGVRRLLLQTIAAPPPGRVTRSQGIRIRHLWPERSARAIGTQGRGVASA